MNVACPDCRSVFRIDPAKVAGLSVRARCSVCNGIIPVSASVAWGEDFPDQLISKPVAAKAEARPLAGATPTQRATGTLPPERRDLSPPPPAALAGSVSKAPLAETPRRSAAMGGDALPSFGTPTFPAASLRPPTPVHSPMAVPHSIPSLARGDESGSAAPRRSTPFSTAAQNAAVSPVAPTPARRVVNPFLSNDPNQKARRLARALVSDMVAYNPQKREEGIKNGSLKPLFRDEIKKSYEEYVEQVGREFAEATSHFQDALNEILAQGRRVF